jgi:hypothetical protein
MLSYILDLGSLAGFDFFVLFAQPRGALVTSWLR